MNIRNGLSTDDGTLIPWSATREQLNSIVGHRNLNEISHDYFVTRCNLLRGLHLSLGFHFVRRKLIEYELFRHIAVPLELSFPEFQTHLEYTFGPPSHTTEPDAEYSGGYSCHEWRFGRIRVRHTVMERFGLEEHVRIRR
jgi:hypothetical protein